MELAAIIWSLGNLSNSIGSGVGWGFDFHAIANFFAKQSLADW